VSKESIQMLMNTKITPYFSEDVAIGYNMNRAGIFPVNLPLYKNEIGHSFTHNFQNIDNKWKTLMVRLHGGLGNQLFQACAGYYLAKKKGFILLLVYSKNLANTHNEEFSTTIFKRFNVILTDDIHYFDKCIALKEPDNSKTCFEYHGDEIITMYENIFLTGYFINKTYVKNAGNDFIELLQNPSVCDDLLRRYTQLDTSYFIHIRRGDYVGNKLYVIDYDDYFTKAINYILQRNPCAHFFIVSDDISFCKTYSVLNHIDKTFIEDMDTLHSFYFMSLCKKGGICSNSTFSGWATNLNACKDMIVIFPPKWINTPNIVDIPFDKTIAF
jgi:hypothetical protein